MNFKRWVEVRQAYLPFLFCILILTISAYKVVVQPLSHVLLLATPWTAACQASLSLTIFWSLSKFMYKAVYSFSIIGYRGCNQCDFSIDHLVMAMCKVVSCVVENRYLLSPVHSLGRIQLAFDLLPFVLQGQTRCYAKYFLTSYFCIPITNDE